MAKQANTSSIGKTKSICGLYILTQYIFQFLKTCTMICEGFAASG